MAFAGAMRQFFGLNGKTLQDFAKELNALSFDEKMEFHRMLNEQAGIQCDPPVKKD